MATMALRLLVRRTAGWLAVPTSIRVGRVARLAPAAVVPWATLSTAPRRSYAKKGESVDTSCTRQLAALHTKTLNSITCFISEHQRAAPRAAARATTAPRRT